MATVVYVHAHPDDEASATAGSMARAVSEGHRVVLVVATNGDHGDEPGDLEEGEGVVQRRRREAEAAGAVIGTHRIVWLGYADSGMSGWEQNNHPESFHQADVDEAADRLAAVLREEAADVVVGYDWHGNYGHPDHVKVHHVTRLAAERAGTPRYLESTMNRDAMRRGFDAMREMGGEDPGWSPHDPMDDGNPIGTPEAELHWACDVSDFVDVKRKALEAHASQSDARELLAMPESMFTAVFGVEYYIEPLRGAEAMVTDWYLSNPDSQ